MKLEPSKLSKPVPQIFAVILLMFTEQLSISSDFASLVQADGPLLYYRFSEAGAASKFTVATNLGSLGATQNGVYEGAVASGTAPGALAGDANDKAGAFSGGDVSIPYSAALNPSGAFTAECWANPSANSGSQYPLSPFSALDSTTGRQGWVLYQNGNSWQFRVGNTGGYIAQAIGGTAPVGQWQHVVGVYDGTNAYLYLNGTLVAGPILQSAAIEPNTTHPTVIGTATDFGRAFAGSIDDAAFYAGALDAATILSHYQNGTNASRAQSYQSLVLASNPVGYWPLDEGPTVYPSAANSGSLGTSADGTYFPPSRTLAGPQPSTFPGFEAANTAVNLDGTNALVRIPSAGTLTNAALTNVTEATFLCWVQRNGPQVSYKGLFAMRPLSTGLYINTDDTLNYAWNDASDTWGFNSGLVPPDGEWTLAAVVVRPDSAIFYMQSVSGGFTNAVNTVTHPSADFTSGPFAVGKDINFAGRFFQGNIDEAALFTSALPEGRIRTYFLTAIGDTHVPVLVSDPPTLSPSGPIYATTAFTLSVDAYAASPSFQWRKGGTPVAGATNYVYTISSAATSDSGNYDVIVSNNSGSITSSVVAVTVITPVAPTITQQPAGRSIYPGGSVTFSVAATGTTPFTYQWFKAGAPITGAKAQTYTLAKVSSSDAADYSVGVTNIAGGSLSSSATLTVLALTPGSYAEAVVTNNPVNYWRLDEATGATIAIDSMGRLDGTYTNGVTLAQPSGLAFDGAGATSVAFDGQGGGIVLNASSIPAPWTAVFWVNRPDPVVASSALLNDAVYSLRLEQWQNTGVIGFTHYGVADYTFGYGTPADTWVQLVFVGHTNSTDLYVNGAHVDSNPNSIALPRQSVSRSNATSDQLVGGLDDVALFDHALTADAIANMYAAAAYGTSTKPFIARQPASETVEAGSSVTLNVLANGTVPLGYQWNKNGTPIAGATSSSLTLSNLTYADAGAYSVSVTNVIGSTNSLAATVTVAPPPTFANLTNGLVMHLTFEGNQLTDSSGQTNDGTAGGSPGFVPGQIGTNALYVNTVHGSSTFNYVAVHSSPSLNFSNSFSVAFWVKYTGFPNDLPMIGNAINSTYQLGWTFTDDTGKMELSLVSTANSGAYVDDPIAGSPLTHDGNWHSVVGVVDRNQQKATVYVDGSLAGSFPILGLGSLDTGNDITLGQDPTGSYGVDGAYNLDDVGIWNRTLTGYDAASIYAAGQRHQSFDVYGPVRIYVNAAGNNIELAWQAGTLQQSSTVNGTYTAVPGATAPFYQTPASAKAMYFRVSP